MDTDLDGTNIPIRTAGRLTRNGGGTTFITSLATTICELRNQIDRSSTRSYDSDPCAGPAKGIFAGPAPEPLKAGLAGFFDTAGDWAAKFAPKIETTNVASKNRGITIIR